jgi:general secretion pathway protein C
MTPQASLRRLQDRVAALSSRERLFLAGGAAALLLFILYMALRGGSEEPAVELAAAPPPPPEQIAPMAAAPAPLPLPAAPAQVAPAAPLSTGGVVLRGVMGGGPAGGAAIFDLPGGVQRVVRVGREIVPGMVLRGIGVSHALASAGGGDIRLELGRSGGTALSSIPQAPAAVQSGGPAPGGGSNPRETMQYRLGLQPVKSGGRVSAYAVKPGAQLPRLEKAGLQPGDVITTVNGARFDEERLLELSWTVANSTRTDIEVMRGGRRMTLSITGNEGK